MMLPPPVTADSVPGVAVAADSDAAANRISVPGRAAACS